MARRVRDDEGARERREIAIGDIDGDALLALRLETVDQQGEIDGVLGCTEFFRVSLQRGELVVENQLLLIEEASDQRGLAVVDRAAGQKAQGRQQRGYRGLVH